MTGTLSLVGTIVTLQPGLAKPLFVCVGSDPAFDLKNKSILLIKTSVALLTASAST